jgi:hypothetical protein
MSWCGHLSMIAEPTKTIHGQKLLRIFPLKRKNRYMKSRISFSSCRSSWPPLTWQGVFFYTIGGFIVATFFGLHYFSIIFQPLFPPQSPGRLPPFTCVSVERVTQSPGRGENTEDWVLSESIAIDHLDHHLCQDQRVSVDPVTGFEKSVLNTPCHRALILHKALATKTRLIRNIQMLGATKANTIIHMMLLEQVTPSLLTCVSSEVKRWSLVED